MRRSDGTTAELVEKAGSWRSDDATNDDNRQEVLVLLLDRRRERRREMRTVRGGSVGFVFCLQEEIESFR